MLTIYDRETCTRVYGGERAHANCSTSETLMPRRRRRRRRRRRWRRHRPEGNTNGRESGWIIYIWVCIYIFIYTTEREKTASAADDTTRLPNLVIGYTPSVYDAILGLTCTPNNRSLLCHGPRDPRGSSPRTVAFLLMLLLLLLQSFVVRSECFFLAGRARLAEPSYNVYR